MSYNQESMPSDIAISIRNVSKKFRLFRSSKERLLEALHPFRKQYHQEFWALHDVTFDIHRGEVIGILGQNGSGKSTLLQIICSVMQATQGKVQASGRISALLELGAGFNPEFTGRDNVLLNGAITGISRKEMLRKLPEIEEFANIGEFFDRPVKTYSSGMYVRVAFAAAIHVDPEILVVDEALSVGDIKFQEKCFRKMEEFRSNGHTIVLVTHSTGLVEQLCDRAIVLEHGTVEYVGDPQSAVNKYESILFPRKTGVGKSEEQLPVNGLTTAGTKDTTSDSAASIDDINQYDSSMGKLLQQFLAESPKSDQCSLRRSYNASELRFGDGGGEIVDYLMISSGEEDPVSIQSGSKVSIYIKVLGRSGIKKPSIGVGIFTHTGLMINSGNARLLKQNLSEIVGGGFYVYRMEFCALMSEGHYFLHFGLTEVIDGKIIRHDARRAVSVFRIPETPHVEGLVDLSMRLQEISTPIGGVN